MEINNLLTLVLYSLSIFLPGILLSSFLHLKEKYIVIALSYGLGSALIATELFIYFFILRFSFSFWLYIFIFLQTIICLIFIISQKNRLDKKDKVGDHWKLAEITLASLIVISILLSVLHATIKPPITYDAVANWSNRSKILLRDGNINFNKTSDSYMAVPATASYPWLTSLSEYWLRRLGSGEIAVNFIPLGYFVSIILGLYYCLKQRLNRFSSLSLVFLFASMPLISYHSFNTYADLPLAYFVIISIILLVKWIKDRASVVLYFSGIFIGLGLFVKNDGLFPIIGWLTAVGLAWYLNRKKISIRVIWKSLGFLVGSIIFWLGFKYALNLGFSSASVSDTIHPEIFSSVVTTLFVHNSWNVWWFIFIVIIILKFKHIYNNREVWSLWFFFIIVFGLTTAVFLCTDYYQYALNFTAIERTMIPLIPISILLLGFTLEEKDKISV